MQKITPFLWFNGQAEEAALFYTRLFSDSAMGSIVRQAPEGPVMTVAFRLFGQEFIALNGGPQFAFTPAVSFVVACDTQQEIDAYWEQLSEGGNTNKCGWLDDRFGLSWQVVPRQLGMWMSNPDTAKAQRVMQALMGMTKINMGELEAAQADDTVAA